MRILHTADWHLGKTIEGRSRMEEQRAFLEDFVGIVRRERPDLVIVAGDVYDSKNPPAEAEKLFYRTLKRITGEGERLVLVIAGNHDSPERLVAAGPLAMEHGILMAGLPGAVIPPGEYGRHRVADSGEGFAELEINGERAVVLLLPYPSEKRLNEAIYGEMEDAAGRAASYGERVGRLFAELEPKFREDTVNLAVSHLFAMDCAAGGSERGLELGGSYLVDGSCLPGKAQYIALGHIHKPQAVPGTQKRAWYSGSPLQYHRSEAGTEKACILADITPGRPAEMRMIRLPVYKPIETWRAGSEEEAVELCRARGGEASWVYLEVETERGYIREDEIKAMKEWKEDILEIRPIVKGKAGDAGDSPRMEEKSLRELFVDYYRQENGGAEPDGELVELLLRLAQEEECHETAEADHEGA